MNGETRLSDKEQDSECYKQLLLTASKVLKTDVDHLQMISAAAIKLLTLTRNENTDVSGLTEIIRTEPALTAKILQVVNSAMFSLPNNVQSISHAINLIGFSGIRQIATEQLLFNQLLVPKSYQRFEPLFFWQHCLFVACLSKQIAIDLNYPNPDILYSAGLLHDIGKLVFEHHGKVAYSDFLSSCDKSDCPTDHNERSFLGMTHTEVGRVFCVKWNLPDVIIAAVGFHHDLAPAHSKYAEYNYETAIIALANYIAQLHGIGASKGEGGRALSDCVLNLVDFRKLDFEKLLKKADQAMTCTSEFYGITFPDIEKLRAALVLAAVKTKGSTDLKANCDNWGINLLSSLVSPHQSLDPQEIVLSTLQAIYDDFGFDRVVMFGMSADRRGLSAKQCWPKHTDQSILIPIDAIEGKLLDCLRNRTAVIIDKFTDSFSDRLTSILDTEGFIAAPVLRNKRLIGVLYADYFKSKKAIGPECLLPILPVANELGVALSHAKSFNLAKKRAEVDCLTQLYNKGKINVLLNDLYQREMNELEMFAIGFVDIDLFKTFNDICGHQAGDDALKIVAEILHSLSRPSDFVGRYGGEEFLFVLRQTNREGAYDYAERIRMEIEKRGKILSCRFNNLALTISIGIAMYNPKYQNYSEHVAMADQAMYRAKSQGRNRVSMID